MAHGLMEYLKNGTAANELETTVPEDGRQLPHAQALDFMLAGKAHFTLRSVKTGWHGAYWIEQCKNNPDLWFVGAQHVPNTRNHGYFAHIRRDATGELTYIRARAEKTDLALGHPLTENFRETFQRLRDGRAIPSLEFWH